MKTVIIVLSLLLPNMYQAQVVNTVAKTSCPANMVKKPCSYYVKFTPKVHDVISGRLYTTVSHPTFGSVSKMGVVMKSSSHPDCRRGQEGLMIVKIPMRVKHYKPFYKRYKSFYCINPGTPI